MIDHPNQAIIYDARLDAVHIPDITDVQDGHTGASHTDSELVSDCARAFRHGLAGPAKYRLFESARDRCKQGFGISDLAVADLRDMPGARKKVTGASGNRVGRKTRRERAAKLDKWFSDGRTFVASTFVVLTLIYVAAQHTCPSSITISLRPSRQRRLGADSSQERDHADVNIKMEGTRLDMVSRTSGMRCYSADNVFDSRTRLGEAEHRYVVKALTRETMQSGGIDSNQEGAADWRLSVLGNRSEVEPGEGYRELHYLKERDGIPYRDLVCETSDHGFAGVVLVGRWSASHTQDECPPSQSMCLTYSTVKRDLKFQINSGLESQRDPSVVISARSPLTPEVVAEMLYVAVAGFRKVVQPRMPLCVQSTKCNASVPKHVLVTNTDHPEGVLERARSRPAPSWLSSSPEPFFFQPGDRGDTFLGSHHRFPLRLFLPLYLCAGPQDRPAARSSAGRSRKHRSPG